MIGRDVLGKRFGGIADIQEAIQFRIDTLMAMLRRGSNPGILPVQRRIEIIRNRRAKLGLPSPILDRIAARWKRERKEEAPKEAEQPATGGGEKTSSRYLPAG